MEVLIKDITSELEKIAPKEYAESYDNIGLVTGNLYNKVENILITLDVTEEVIYESINKKCNLIISFHPIIFKPLKNITGKNYSEKVIISALKNDICIYIIHTNLDVSWNGSLSYICKLLEIKREKVMFPKHGIIKKLITYVPINYAKKIRDSLFKVGAGNISNYSKCSYNIDGLGSYMGNEKTKPFIGKKKVFHMEKETCISVLFPYHKLNTIKKTLIQNHPYEEVAYEIHNIENENNYVGIGIIGFLKEEMSECDFLYFLKKRMNLSRMRHSNFIGKKIKKIAIITGSGSFGIKKSIIEKSDVFISSDLKYHDFFQAEKKILIVDVEHYESEKFNKKLLKSFLDKTFNSVSIFESETYTNPIKYF
ncbi:Nif3-like dinuclear metal center hexameric protein [Blattabacterium cuenoti]|uniref:Nif3-like dinuclear metal center hexameric protein n=1 Tax=Blattabacterium cuenoti TaxID=1653831 RepID=UPI00163BF83F|nr:Nif3-like dinuclear metal center hexameric protein [Blattabacterium cuenoti]